MSLEPWVPILRDANARLSRELRQAGGSIWSADVGDRQLEVVDLSVTHPDDVPGTVIEALGTNLTVLRDRVYEVDGRRACWARSWLPTSLVSGTAIEQEDTGPGGSLARLAEVGFPVANFVEDVAFIEAGFVTNEEQAKLAIGRAESVVQIVRHSLTAEHRVVEVTDMLLVAGAYRFRWSFPA